LAARVLRQRGYGDASKLSSPSFSVFISYSPLLFSTWLLIYLTCSCLSHRRSLAEEDTVVLVRVWHAPLRNSSR
jgi:hypothetical protein